MSRAFAVEDKNLNQASIIVSRNKLYRDIDLSFTVKPSGEIYKKIDAGAVKQAIKNLLLTNHFEKPFLPLYGGNLRDLLFELAHSSIGEEITSNITRAIESYEPRVKIVDIRVDNRADYNSIGVTVEFRIVNTEETVIFTTTLVRLR
jgi:phage baseplate assembly protein W